MVFEQLVLSIGVGLTMGAIIALAGWVKDTQPWNNRQFAYALIIGVFTSFLVIEGFEGGVDESNLLNVLVEIAGLSFFANVGVKAGARLQKK